MTTFVITARYIQQICGNIDWPNRDEHPACWHLMGRQVFEAVTAGLSEEQLDQALLLAGGIQHEQLDNWWHITGYVNNPYASSQMTDAALKKAAREELKQ